MYGATKLCSDKLFISANSIKGKRDVIFSVVRYGNVMGSRGSVIPVFNKQKKNKILTITDKRMTRFSLPIEESVNLVLHALKNAIGGEIFVPKIPSFKVLDLAKAICDKCTIKIIGIRPGEKLHEELISSHDSMNTYDIGKYYVITDSSKKSINFYKRNKKVPLNFEYNSLTNPTYLNVKQLKDLLIKTKLV